MKIISERSSQKKLMGIRKNHRAHKIKKKNGKQKKRKKSGIFRRKNFFFRLE